jgi:lysyl-tRNA synthetase class 2
MEVFLLESTVYSATMMLDTAQWRRLQTDEVFKQRIFTRAKILMGIREFFDAQGFLSVETPIIVRTPDSEPTLTPFLTEVVRNDGKVFPAALITSPEYSCKKLLGAGFTKLYEITKCFRNGEPWNGTHNHEFTMIEWYRADADYRDIMVDTEQLVAALAQKIHGSTTVMYQGREINLAAPWRRMSVAEAMQAYAGIDLDRGIDDPEWFRAEAVRLGETITDNDSWDDVFFKIFLTHVELKIGTGDPVILYDYPRSMAALARISEKNPRYAERFEAYAGGMELCNAYSELNNSAEQRQRLLNERARRAEEGKPQFPLDEEFVAAVGEMPNTGGIALGVDRVVMLLTDAKSINDVHVFPAADLFRGAE